MKVARSVLAVLAGITLISLIVEPLEFALAAVQTIVSGGGVSCESWSPAS